MADAHDGSVGFFVQSTVAGVVPVVQLPAAHVDPVPLPPDGAFGTDVLVRWFIADVLLGRLDIIDEMFVGLGDVELVTLMGIVVFVTVVVFVLGITVNVADLEAVL